MWKGILAAVLVVASFGCGDREAPAEVEETSAETTTREAVMPEPEPVEETGVITIDETEAPSLLDGVDLRRAGSTEQAKVAGTFAPGDELELIVSVKDVPVGLAAWVHWIGPDGEKIAEEQKSVPQEAFVTFLADTTGWDPGEYTAEIYVGGDLGETRSFELVEEGEASDN